MFQRFSCSEPWVLSDTASLHTGASFKPRWANSEPILQPVSCESCYVGLPVRSLAHLPGTNTHTYIFTKYIHIPFCMSMYMSIYIHTDIHMHTEIQTHTHTHTQNSRYSFRPWRSNVKQDYQGLCSHHAGQGGRWIVFWRAEMRVPDSVWNVGAGVQWLTYSSVTLWNFGPTLKIIDPLLFPSFSNMPDSRI